MTVAVCPFPLPSPAVPILHLRWRWDGSGDETDMRQALAWRQEKTDHALPLCIVVCVLVAMFGTILPFVPLWTIQFWVGLGLFGFGWIPGQGRTGWTSHCARRACFSPLLLHCTATALHFATAASRSHTPIPLPLSPTCHLPCPHHRLFLPSTTTSQRHCIPVGCCHHYPQPHPLSQTPDRVLPSALHTACAPPWQWAHYCCVVVNIVVGDLPIHTVLLLLPVGFFPTTRPHPCPPHHPTLTRSFPHTHACLCAAAFPTTTTTGRFLPALLPACLAVRTHRTASLHATLPRLLCLGSFPLLWFAHMVLRFLLCILPFACAFYAACFAHWRPAAAFFCHLAIFTLQRAAYARNARARTRAAYWPALLTPNLLPSLHTTQHTYYPS